MRIPFWLQDEMGGGGAKGEFPGKLLKRVGKKYFEVL
jgi:hypothetical protein